MSIRTWFNRSPKGGKDKTMSTTPTTTPTPTATPAFDQAALNTAVTEALKAQLPGIIQQAQAPLLEQINKLQAPATATPTATPADKNKPLSAEDVTKIVTDSLKTFQQASQQNSAREAFQRDKLKDLPDVYQNLLGSDPNNWATEEQTIRGKFKEALKGAGVKVEDVGGGQTGGQPAGVPVDLSKLTPQQLILQGLKESKPVGPAGVGDAVRTQPGA